MLESREWILGNCLEVGMARSLTPYVDQVMPPPKLSPASMQGWIRFSAAVVQICKTVKFQVSLEGLVQLETMLILHLVENSPWDSRESG